MIDAQRVSMLSGRHCRLCLTRGCHEWMRCLRLVVASTVDGSTVYVNPTEGLWYCPRCDGPLAAYACENPGADAGTEVA